MRIVFVSDHAYLPHRVGGRESSIDELAYFYQSRGHDVTVLARKPLDRLSQMRKQALRTLLGRRWRASYRVLRTWDLAAAIGATFRDRQADCYLINLEHAERWAQTALARSIYNQIIYLRDVENVEAATPLTFPQDALLVANSSHTAQAYSARTGRDPLVVTPLITPGRYATETSGAFVTFVNPVRHKGVEIALEIAAALPEIPFLFVEGWPMSRSKKTTLRRRAAALGNVRFCGNVLDMRKVYSLSRLLIVPSVWQEGFGRVVVEAQASGIPSVASNRGGIPEAIGQAGILLKPSEPIGAWVDAVRDVWSNSSLRAGLSRAAREMAHRHYDAAAAGAIRLLDLAAERVRSGQLTVRESRNASYAAEC